MAEKTKAELEAEIAALKEKLDKENKADDKADEAKIKAYLNEQVQVKLFKDGEKYNDDLVIGLNGKTVRIQRGVWVSIKRKYALLIDEHEVQEIRAAEAFRAAEATSGTGSELND
ncbi:MAG: hypothetical protein IKI51_02155 [Clostridia bacterium]|nr:hypothetical protein [Clostridia bacterium]